MIDAVRAELIVLWHWLASVQRDILAETAALLRTFADTGDWSVLIAFAPWAILFGAAHALTPGHSKTVLALWSAGSGAGRGAALRTAMVLAATHIGMSVLVVLAALPVVTLARGEAGRAPLLEDISRLLLGLCGLWLIWQGLRPAAHRHDGPWFGVAAGLIPCPLTLFVMTYAAAKGVILAGLGFAAMTLVGVALVLGVVALTAAVLGTGLSRIIPGTALAARGLTVATGLALLWVSVAALLR
jgi:ABC-type nickel/cobalt efflux system permease component RcnA